MEKYFDLFGFQCQQAERNGIDVKSSRILNSNDGFESQLAIINSLALGI